MFYGRDKGIHVIGDYTEREIIFTKGCLGRLSAFEIPHNEEIEHHG